MVQILELDHLEYNDALLDSPEFRDKLQRHEKYIEDTNKNIKNILKRCTELINCASQLHNQQEQFANCLKEFTIGFVGKMNDEETYIVETLNSINNLIDDVREFSSNMVTTSTRLFEQIHEFRKDKIENYRFKKREYEKQTTKYCQQLDKYLSVSARKHVDENHHSSSTLLSPSALTNPITSTLKQLSNSVGGGSGNSSQNNTQTSYSINSNGDDYKQVKEETQNFYRKCLDYVNTIQEFEENWFQYFSESMFMFIKNWTTFYHESYERHLEYEPYVKKSQSNIQILRENFTEYFSHNSKKLIDRLLEEPDTYLNSYQTLSPDQLTLTTKQGYLYLFKKTLGQSTWSKHFCKYYKDDKKLEIVSYNQLSSNHHYHNSRNKVNIETYYIINCIKSINDKLDKRFIFDLICKDSSKTSLSTSQSNSSYNNNNGANSSSGNTTPTSLNNSSSSISSSQTILTFQALSNDDFKSWFSIMEGKDIPKSQRMSNEPIYILDNNGLKFIQKCISMLENEIRINEEGIYRKNGVSHKITQFIEKYCENINVNHKVKQNKETTSSSSTSSSSTSTIANQSSSFLEYSNVNTADDIDTCTITSALKYFLIHCNEPLMTYKYNNDFLKAVRIENLNERLIEINLLLERLPSINFQTLKSLMRHLHNVSKFSKLNKMTISNLSTCFGPTVFRTEQECVTNLYNIKFYSEIIELLIMYHDKMFEKDFKQILKQEEKFKEEQELIEKKLMQKQQQQNISTISLTPTAPVISILTLQNEQKSSSATMNTNANLVKLRRNNTTSRSTNNRNGICKPTELNKVNNSNLSLSSDSSHDGIQDLTNNSELVSSQSSFINIKTNSTITINKNPRASIDSNFSSTTPTTTNNNNIKSKRAKTLFSCKADNPSELSFEADTILINIKASKENGWCEATGPDGKTGLVPFNYIKFIDDL